MSDHIWAERTKHSGEARSTEAQCASSWSFPKHRVKHMKHSETQSTSGDGLEIRDCVEKAKHSGDAQRSRKHDEAQ